MHGLSLAMDLHDPGGNWLDGRACSSQLCWLAIGEGLIFIRKRVQFWLSAEEKVFVHQEFDELVAKIEPLYE